MRDTVRAQYPYTTVADCISRFINIKQRTQKSGDPESLLEYVKRFKHERDVVKQMLGDRFLDTFVESTAVYKDLPNNNQRAAAQKKLKEEAFAAFASLLLLKGADSDRYAGLLKHLNLQYSLGQDQFPKTLSEAVDALERHKPDQSYYDKLNRQREKSRKDKDKSKDRERPSPNETSFAQQQKQSIFCYCCGSKAHKSDKCPERNTKPKAEWFHNRAMAHYQEEEINEEDDNNHT